MTRVFFYTLSLSPAQSFTNICIIHVLSIGRASLRRDKHKMKEKEIKRERERGNDLSDLF